MLGLLFSLLIIKVDTLHPIIPENITDDIKIIVSNGLLFGKYENEHFKGNMIIIPKPIPPTTA